ncbi:Tfp pilus assembly protein FimT/FimU [Planctomycetota bacterium]
MIIRKKAFSLTELIIVLVLLGIFAGIAVPRFNFALVSKKKAHALTQKIVTDLRRTRSLAIVNAAENTVGFALNMTGASPYASYEIQNLDTSTTVDSHTIEPDTSCSGGANFNFGPLGNLLAGSDTSLSISAGGDTFAITITSATGMVRIDNLE